MALDMENFVTQFQLVDEANKLAEAIIKQYAKYNICRALLSGNALLPYTRWRL